MGPYFSALGAAQYLVRQRREVRWRRPTRRRPDADFNNLGALEHAKENGIETKGFLENVPITDGAAVALKLVRRPRATAAASCSRSRRRRR